jgi:hypothetical protein
MRLLATAHQLQVLEQTFVYCMPASMTEGTRDKECRFIVTAKEQMIEPTGKPG